MPLEDLLNGAEVPLGVLREHIKNVLEHEIQAGEILEVSVDGLQLWFFPHSLSG